MEMDLESEYFRCSFVECDFSNVDFGDTLLEDCVFRHCNLSMCRFPAALCGVSFEACKLTGADFSCGGRVVHHFAFKDSRLNETVFADTKFRKTLFDHCGMQNAVFDRADATGCRFDGCDFDGASFVDTNLERADFSTAFNYAFVPHLCRLRKTVFSESGLRGLVRHLDIIVV